MRIETIVIGLSLLIISCSQKDPEKIKELEQEITAKQKIIDSLSYKTKVIVESTNEPNQTNKTEAMSQNDEPKVTGIGGIFFKSDNPKETMSWYGENLGLAITPYGSPFEFRNANRPDEINYLNWSAFPKETDYFQPSEKQFMINYRVQNLEKLIEKLKANGVTICDEIDTYDYGKFIHIMDPEGNKIELWEPVDSVFTKMGGPTTK